MHDIVYILRNDINTSTEELRYSLRSLENFPHGKVWFFGGVPKGIEPDMQVEFQQHGMSNWMRVRNSIERVCKTAEVSEDFWLFNDDFFIMRPIEELPPLYDRTLYQRVKEIIERHGGESLYTKELSKLREFLIDHHMKTYNYATHTPLLINKKKALEILRKYPGQPMFRSLYGNYWKIGGKLQKDCKIVKRDIKPSEDAILLSTSETSFAKGEVGKFIRSKFPEPSRFEKDRQNEIQRNNTVLECGTVVEPVPEEFS